MNLDSDLQLLDRTPEPFLKGWAPTWQCCGRVVLCRTRFSNATAAVGLVELFMLHERTRVLIRGLSRQLDEYGRERASGDRLRLQQVVLYIRPTSSSIDSSRTEVNVLLRIAVILSEAVQPVRNTQSSECWDSALILAASACGGWHSGA